MEWWRLGLACALVCGCKERAHGQPSPPIQVPAVETNVASKTCSDPGSPYLHEIAGGPTVEGCIVGDRFVGSYRVTLPGGVVIAKGQFSSEGKTGQWQFRYPDGTPWREGRYDKGLRTGTWKTYRATGAAGATTEFTGGVGTETAFWINGTKKRISQVRGGRRHGTSRFWSDDGTLTHEGNYAGGWPDGTWTFFAADGQVRKRQFWERGDLRETEWAQSATEPVAEDTHE